MNLPTFTDLNTNPARSTYYTFSKAFFDLDKAISNEKVWHFSKFVGLNLPLWALNSIFFKFRKSTSNPAGNIVHYYESSGNPFPELDNTPATSPNYVNPNMVLPRLLEYYVENIIRQTNVCPSSSTQGEQIAELAFWKLLHLIGMTDDNIDSAITYVADISTISFTEISNNHGWAEIMAGIPAKAPKTVITDVCWDTLSDINNTIAADTTNDHAIYDNSPFGFNMTATNQNYKRVLNFANVEENKDFVTVSNMKVNTLLLFYTDESGKHKLHGVDFIYPFEDLGGGTGWKQETISFNTNTLNNFGYSFRFNMKSCTNQGTKDEIYEINEGTFYDVFCKCISDFDSFLEKQKQEGKYIPNWVS